MVVLVNITCGNKMSTATPVPTGINIIQLITFNKVDTYRLIHGHSHIGLVIIPLPILALDLVSGQYGNAHVLNYLSYT